MWNVDITSVQPLIQPLLRLTDDIFDWAIAQDIKLPADILEQAAKNAPGPIGQVAKTTSLRHWMVKLVKCEELNDVFQAYRRMTTDYAAFIEQGAEVYQPRTTSTWILLRECFDYLYDQLLNTEIFCQAYCADHRIAQAWAAEYRRRFGRVRRICPYCDAAQVANADSSSIDHFLPRRYFPLLAVYGSNLVVSCTRCNDRVKGSTLVGTWDGQASYVPILHPFYHEPAQHFVFRYVQSEQLTDIDIHILTDDNREAHRTQHYLSLFRIAELYRDLLPELNEERVAFRRRIRNRYRSVHEAGGQQTIADIMRDELNAAIATNSLKKGEFSLTKAKNDLYQFLLANLDLEVAFLEHLEEKASQVHQSAVDRFLDHYLTGQRGA